MRQRLRCFAASCWRIVLALLLALILLPTAAFFLLAPDAKSLQPQLEQMVAQRMGLAKVALGALSWHWNGWLWLHSDHLSLATPDDTLHFDEAAIDIRLSLSDLVHGDITPNRLQFHGGTMAINRGFFDTPPISLPAIRYTFDGLTVRWTDRQLTHDFLINKLDINLGGGALILRMKEAEIRGTLRADLLPQQLHIRWQNLRWLPQAWVQGWLDGQLMGDVRLSATDHLRWKLHSQLDRSGDAPLALHLGSGDYPFDHIEADLLSVWKRSGNGIALASLQLSQASWRLAQQAVRARGEWQAGVATLEAHADALRMPLVWSWLHPLGASQWHQWLSSMQSGQVTDANASLSLPWPNPLTAMPDWSHMRYQVRAQLSDVDIALGLRGDVLTAARGTLGVDEHRLWAKVEAATLPHHLGAISGNLTIPWDTLELVIHGQGKTDLQQILHWQGVKEQVRWHQSQAKANFDLRWKVNASKPGRAKVTLRPVGLWDLTFSGIHARMEDGYLEWLPGALAMQEMTFHIGQLGGSCTARLHEGAKGWQLSDFSARSRVDLTNANTLAQPFIKRPHGELQLALRFDGGWHGTVDATDASWSNLLGSHKKAGDPFTISLPDIRFAADGSHWSVRGMESQGEALMLHGGNVGFRQGQLWVDMPRLRTSAVDGAFHFTIPESKARAARVRFSIQHLNRDALRPLVENWRHRSDKRRWLADGTIHDFRWGENLRASGVTVTRDNAGMNLVKIARLQLEEFTALGLTSRFTLAPNHVDVRELRAAIDDQQLMMSATLRKAPQSGWLWSGFAALDGSFGGLMEKMSLSRLFSDGTIHSLFVGHGMLRHGQPWWQSLQGRLRMRVDDGRILKSGTLTRLLAATSLVDLPRFLVGDRKDLVGEGMLFRHLQLEGTMDRGIMKIRRMALRSSAMDVAGIGSLDIGHDRADVYLVAHPFQNLDAMLSSIPLLRDIIGGPAHSLFRKIYHLYGPLNDAKIEPSTPKAAGLKSAGVIDTLLNLPTLWFGVAATP
ncbi:MAG: AsmA-like C-terminal region-containing protein [Mariprofundales bacterium]